MRNRFSTFLRVPGLPVEKDDGGRWALALFVRTRFANGLLQLALLLPALKLGWMLPGDLPWYLAAVFALWAFNLASTFWLRAGNRVSPGFLLLHTAVDLSAMTVLFGVSGGLTNPVHSLIHFQVGMASLLLPARLAPWALVMGWASLAVLGWSSQSLTNAYAWAGPLGPNLAYEWILAAAVAGLAMLAARVNAHYRARLQDARERMRQQDRLRAAGAVASGFCHELASPLNAAGLLASRLRRKGGVDETLAEEWDELQESLARCDRIVRVMAGAPWSPEDIAVQRTDISLLLRKLAAEWNGRVPLRLADVSGSCNVQAPPVGIGQTLQGLLRNSEEASPTGSAVEVALSTDNSRAEITVADRGPGIDPEILRALGTPFNSRKGEGRGLGLFAALHFTESLGGSLTFEAREGGGTVARLSLPRAFASMEDRA